VTHGRRIGQEVVNYQMTRNYFPGCAAVCTR
jgi:hypothetical protein